MSNAKPSDLFSERLREALDLAGLSQTDLAKKAKLQPSAISHFASGARTPSFDNLYRVATALGISADYLMGRTESPAVDGASAPSDASPQWAGLTQEQRGMVNDFIQILVKRS